MCGALVDWRNFPSLASLRAFAAFAGAGSLEEAGARTGVTHAAISQQIRALEAHLGIALVERGGRRLGLTPEGRRLAGALDEGFGRIGDTIAALTGADQNAPLRITSTPAFAAGWLMPRLPEFRARHPGIDLAIDPAHESREIGREADVGLRYGTGDWPGLESRLLLESPVVVVAAPALVPVEGPVALEDLMGLTWLQDFGTTETTAFLEKYRLTRREGAAILSLPGNLLLDAARDGQGVAVLTRAFVEADLAAGRLRLLLEDDEREGYYLVTRPGPQRPALRAFCTWALRQSQGPSVPAGMSRRI